MQRYTTPRRGIRMPPRIVRRTTFLRRSLYGAMRAGRVLRAIGAPPMKHVISRPGQVIRIVDNGTNLQVNGNIANNTGLQAGMFASGRSGGILYNSIKFGLSQLFQFSFLQSPADLSGLYDNYRIKAVKLRIDLSYNTAQAHQSPSNVYASMPMMHYCVDPDDITCPTDETSVLQYSKSKSLRLGDKPVFITLQPRAQGTAASTVTTGGTGGAATAPVVANMLSTNTWFDAVNGQTIPHFGLKYFFDGLPIGSVVAGQVNWCITITPTYILEVKNIH